MELSFEEYDVTEPLFMERLHQIWAEEAKNLRVDESKLFDVYENEVLDKYQEYQSLSQRLDKIKLERQEILENIACYEIIEQFFGGG